jgi:hypothetical protein
MSPDSPARQTGRRIKASGVEAVEAQDRAAFTIAEFCQAHRISRSKLYQLWAAGIGPRFMKVGVKVLVSIEAAADWRREREQAAAEAAKAEMLGVS